MKKTLNDYMAMSYRVEIPEPDSLERQLGGTMIITREQVRAFARYECSYPQLIHEDECKSEEIVFADSYEMTLEDFWEVLEYRNYAGVSAEVLMDDWYFDLLDLVEDDVITFPRWGEADEMQWDGRPEEKKLLETFRKSLIEDRVFVPMNDCDVDNFLDNLYANIQNYRNNQGKTIDTRTLTLNRKKEYVTHWI